MTNLSQTTQQSHAADDEIDLGSLIGTVVAARWIIAACTAVALLMGGAYAWMATPIYQVDATVQVEDSKGSALGGAVKDLDGLFDTTSQATTEIELLRSRMVLGRAIDQLALDLVVTPRYFPVVGEAIARRHRGDGPATGFGPYAWGGERLHLTRLTVPDVWEGQSLTLITDGRDGFRLLGPDETVLGRGRVGAEFVAKTDQGPVGLFVRSLVARPGVEFQLMRLPRLNVIQSVKSNLSASEKGKQSGIIELTLKGPDPKQAVALLNAIANQYVRQNVERKSAEAEQTLKYLEQQLPETKQQLDAAEVRFNVFRSRNGTLDVSKEGELLLQQSVQAETGVVELQQKRKELIQRFTPEHPSVKALDAQIAALQAQRGKYASEVDKLPQTQQEVLRLTRDLQVTQEIYTGLLNNAQQLKVVRGGTVGNVRIIDVAEASLHPIEPKRSQVVILSLLLGLIAGIAIAFIRSALKSGVMDTNEIESKLGLSVLATIPVSAAQDALFKGLSKNQSKLSVLAHTAPDDLSIESLRSLRTSLHFALLDAPNNVIMITGPSPQVGKSFVSVNLAGVIAAAGQKVLLIDGDMRRGYLNEYFGHARDGGLSELIAGQREADSVIRASGIPGFDYVTTGALPPNPSELLLHPRFEAFLSAMSSRYNHILIDSPPVMAVTDAAIIGRHAGATLLLARFAYTPLREIDYSVKRLQQAGVAVKGVLLNRVEVSNGYGYRYGNKYAYAYQYGKRD